MLAQRRLLEAREAIEARGQRTAEAKAAVAALAERSAALAAEVRRREDASGELQARVAVRREVCDRTTHQRQALEARIRGAARSLETDVRSFEHRREQVRSSNDHLSELRSRVDAQEGQVRATRGILEEQRGIVSLLDVARATSEANLSHLETSCLDTLQLPMDQVSAEVEELERDGEIRQDTWLIGDDTEELEGDESVAHDPARLAEPDVAGAVAAAGDTTASHQVGTTLGADAS